jgi:hypothetical protein
MVKMIKNKVCPYCRIALIKAENKDNSRSVEHLIPNVALTRKRNKGEGDFYACRKCNMRKSNIDNMLGVVAKCQTIDNDIASKTLIKAVTKGDGASKRFKDMVRTAERNVDEVHMRIPIKGPELVEYIHFLGKGQYFKDNLVPFDPDKLEMEILFANKQVTGSLISSYKEKHGSDPFRDLEKNSFSKIINNGECIIYSKENEYMFSFHDYTVITVKILNKSRKNKKIAYLSRRQIVKDFKKYS